MVIFPRFVVNELRVEDIGVLVSESFGYSKVTLSEIVFGYE